MNKDSINAEMRLNKAEYDPQKFLVVADSYSYYHELSESGFYDRMLLIANAFEEMRYAYEYRSLKTEIIFLESFTKYLKETAHNIIDTNQQIIPSSPVPDDQSP